MPQYIIFLILIINRFLRRSSIIVNKINRIGLKCLSCDFFEIMQLYHKIPNAYGGEGGIRTHERDKPLPVFKTGAFDRALPPLRRFRLPKTERRLPDDRPYIQP